jgi:hypothetical protein
MLNVEYRNCKSSFGVSRGTFLVCFQNSIVEKAKTSPGTAAVVSFKAMLKME